MPRRSLRDTGFYYEVYCWVRDTFNGFKIVAEPERKFFKIFAKTDDKDDYIVIQLSSTGNAILLESNPDVVSPRRFVWLNTEKTTLKSEALASLAIMLVKRNKKIAAGKTPPKV